jgi:hypothetical protein
MVRRYLYLYLVVAAILLLGVVASVIYTQQLSSEMLYWSYVRPVDLNIYADIYNAKALGITSYVVRFTVPFMIGMRTDFYDVRFVRAGTPLIQNLTRFVEGSFAVVDVVLPDALDSGSYRNYLELYYGNPNASRTVLTKDRYPVYGWYAASIDCNNIVNVYGVQVYSYKDPSTGMYGFTNVVNVWWINVTVSGELRVYLYSRYNTVYNVTLYRGFKVTPYDFDYSLWDVKAYVGSYRYASYVGTIYTTVVIFKVNHTGLYSIVARSLSNDYYGGIFKVELLSNGDRVAVFGNAGLLIPIDSRRGYVAAVLWDPTYVSYSIGSAAYVYRPVLPVATTIYATVYETVYKEIGYIYRTVYVTVPTTITAYGTLTVTVPAYTTFTTTVVTPITYVTTYFRPSPTTVTVTTTQYAMTVYYPITTYIYMTRTVTTTVPITLYYTTTSTVTSTVTKTVTTTSTVTKTVTSPSTYTTTTVVPTTYTTTYTTVTTIVTTYTSVIYSTTVVTSPWEVTVITPVSTVTKTTTITVPITNTGIGSAVVPVYGTATVTLSNTNPYDVVTEVPVTYVAPNPEHTVVLIEPYAIGVAGLPQEIVTVTMPMPVPGVTVTETTTVYEKTVDVSSIAIVGVVAALIGVAIGYLVKRI